VPDFMKWDKEGWLLDVGSGSVEVRERGGY